LLLSSGPDRVDLVGVRLRRSDHFSPNSRRVPARTGRNKACPTPKPNPARSAR
jgi:hypothetical protein